MPQYLENMSYSGLGTPGPPIATGRCICGKLCLVSERAAKEVVFEARLARAIRNSHRRREDRYYQCRYGAWHTTSQPQLNARERAA